jgi:predicted Zn-dependent peptidase
MGYQSKSETVARAAKIALEELERMRREEVSDEELATAKASFIDVFPRQFESAGRTVGLFVRSEYEGRPHEYWLNYQDNVRAVTKQDVLRAAQEHLSSEDLVFLIVGNWEQIEAGDADGRASMKEFAGGAATELPMRDPLTLEPISPGAGG